MQLHSTQSGGNGRNSKLRSIILAKNEAFVTCVPFFLRVSNALGAKSATHARLAVRWQQVFAHWRYHSQREHGAPILSGMARSIIHGSDYESKDAAIEAINLYFIERNENFKANQRRAGNKIWGKERAPSEFSSSHNCKDPAYR